MKKKEPLFIQPQSLLKLVTVLSNEISGRTQALIKIHEPFKKKFRLSLHDEKKSPLKTKPQCHGYRREIGDLSFQDSFSFFELVETASLDFVRFLRNLSITNKGIKFIELPGAVPFPSSTTTLENDNPISIRVFAGKNFFSKEPISLIIEFSFIPIKR